MSTTTERGAATTLGTPRRVERALATTLSATLHTLVFLALAATSVRITTPDRVLIPLVIRNPPPPPPPPGPGGPEGTSIVAPPPAQPPPLAQPKPQPVPPKPAKEPRKIAAKQPPKPVPAEPPAETSLAPPAAEVAAPGTRAGGGTAGGVVGGKLGGQVGGRIGGTGDDVYTVDQVAVPPKLVHNVVPDYPVVARARGQEGVVVLQGIIDRSGEVENDNVTVLQSQAPFDDPAIKAFRQWRFTPGRNNAGDAVRVVVRQPMRFKLR